MVSIGSLPVEILLQIIRLAVESGPQPAGICAAVSRQWKELVEPQTFALLRLDPGRVLAAKDILTPVRQAYVHHIRMEVLLPDYDVAKLCLHRETDDEQQQNSQAFTRAIVGLFACLSHWEASAAAANQRGVTLELCAFSPADRRDIGMPYGPRMRMPRWEHSYLSLENGVEVYLPALGMITNFVVSHPHHLERRVAARVCGVMASKMTSLKSVDWNLHDNEKENAHLRRKIRQEFAASLASFPQSVRHFRLWYPYIEPRDHDFQPPRIYDDDSASDPLSIALRDVAQQCITFDLDATVVLDTGFFWPRPPASDLDAKPHWSRLEEIKVMTSTVSPLGIWLFDENRSAQRVSPPPRPDPIWMPEILTGEVLTGDELDCWYRVCPKQACLEEWFLAAARAAACMPRLRLLSVEWNLALVTCEFVYDVLDGKVPRFYCGSTPALTMSAEVEAAWRAAARVHVGDGVEMELELEDMGEIVDPISKGF